MGKKSKNNRNNNRGNSGQVVSGPARPPVVYSPRPAAPPTTLTSFLISILHWIFGTLLSLFGIQESFSSVSTDLGDIRSLITDDILDAILSRGVDERLNTRQALRDYLLKLLSEPQFRPLTIPLLKGLWLGPPHINQKILLLPDADEGFPILIWVCQWKLLTRCLRGVEGSWPAEAELVDMVLRAGAKVNQTLQNKTTALFFAVRYGDLRTVNLLLAAGGNIRQKDQFGRTCLYNAIEHPQPPIIALLLRCLPATETYENGYPDGSTFRATTADQLIHMLVQKSALVSWVNLGPPSADSLIEALMLIRQNGGRFTPEGSALSLNLLGRLFRSDIALEKSKLNAPDLFKAVAQSIIGERIPQALRPPESDPASPQDLDVEPSGPCPICEDVLRKPIALYCGHYFCRKCIVEYGKQDDGRRCPVCRSKLCGDLHTQSDVPLSGTQLLGLAHSPEYGSIARLTDDQVVAEARFQGIFSRRASIQALRYQMQEELGRVYEAGARPQLGRKVTVDLSAGCSISSDTAGFICPKEGRVYIEVSIRNVPVLARISNRSLYTVVSRSVVKQLRLHEMDQLKSPKFVCVLTGKKIRDITFRCLEPFSLRVGGIEVTLRNAIAADSDPYPMFGIQLGMDFLSSAIWCPIDVETAAVSPSAAFSGYMRVDGEICWAVTKKSKEVLRYYAHNGAYAHVPLHHFSPFNDNIILGVAVKENVNFDQCFWCCRAFPEGMVSCAPCQDAGNTITYCDNSCQKAAWKIHKRTHDATNEPIEG